MKKEHTHSWEAIAYFYSDGAVDEWLVIECSNCQATQVLKGRNQRDKVVNQEF